MSHCTVCKEPAAPWRRGHPASGFTTMGGPPQPSPWGPHLSSSSKALPIDLGKPRERVPSFPYVTSPNGCLSPHAYAGWGGDGVPPGEDVTHPALAPRPSPHQTPGAACDSQSDRLLSPRNACVCTAPPTRSSLPSRSQHPPCSRPAHSPLPSALPTNIYPTLSPQSSTRLTNTASLGPPSYEESPGSPA